MIDNNHYCFAPPKNNCALWRYMDLTKLLSLLERSQLFFARADLFEDPYEGCWPKASISMLQDPNARKGMPPIAVDQFLNHTEEMRRRTFISCWFASEHESAAMWKLYLQSNEGVAIRSDHDALVKALDASPLKARTSMVRYIDYDSTPLPIGNFFFPLLHKRMSFSHENELRALIWSEEDVNASLIDRSASFVTVDINPQDLIKAVHVAPTAPTWFGELVEQLLKRYGLTCPVEKSNLYNRPTY